MTTTQTRPTPTPPSRRPRRYLLIAAAIALVVVAGFLLWFFNRDVPEEVSLDAAVSGLSSTTTSTTVAPSGSEPAPSTTSASTPSGVDGTWSVDTSVGEFSFENATSSFVGFRIAEELASIGSTEAVGRTPSVEGTLEFDGATLLSAAIEADLRDLITNDSRRDSRVQGALETGSFPNATFVLSSPVDFGAVPEQGVPVSVVAAGELTIHGVTQAVDFPLEAQLVDDVIVVVGSVTITMADFGVSVPSAPIVLSASDEAVLEVQLFFAQS